MSFLLRVPAIGLCLAALPDCATGQEPRPFHKIGLPGESKPVAQRLENIDRLISPDLSIGAYARLITHLGTLPLGPLVESVWLADGQRRQQKWDVALGEYLRIMDEAGDELAPLPAGADELPTSIQVRRLCHARIALAPPSILRLYRERVDRSAKKLLDEGIKERDVAPLRRLVTEYFCSRHAEQALDLLGDLAFEKGNFSEALYWWEMLVPAPSKPATVPVFPDPVGDVARVQAKQILAHIFSGEKARAARELTLFSRLHAGAQGHLAGKKGKYSEILQEWMGRLEAGKLSLDERDWLTFAGSPTRNRVFAESPNPRLWAEGPAWAVDLETGKKIEPPSWYPFPNSQRARRLAYHPIIVGDKVLVSDAETVSAYHLHTGQPLFRYRLAKDRTKSSANAGDVRFTLTATPDRVYARLGGLVLGAKKEGQADSKSYLVCLDLTDAAKDKRELWSVEARGPGGGPAFFEGVPVAHEGRVFVAMSRLLGGRVMTAIACYEGVSGAPAWMHDVCYAPEPGEIGARAHHHLLTLAGTYLCYCSHSGAVVALDLATGERAWAVRYPSRGTFIEDRMPSSREVCPPLFHDGRLFVAPFDADRILCIDAASGRVLWQRERIEVVHLLGATNGLLYFNTTRGLQAIRTETGLDEGGWLQPPVEDKFGTFGRGLLAGRWVFWPTEDSPVALCALSLMDGNLEFDRSQLHQFRPGNIVFANGCIVVADAELLVGYVPEDRPQNRFLGEPRGVSPRSPPVAYAVRSPEPLKTPKTIRVAWETSGERWLGNSAGGSGAPQILAITGDQLIARKALDGSVLWKSLLSFTPRRSICAGGKLFLAGDNILEARSPDDGRRLWSASLASKLDNSPITELRVCGSILFVLQDARRLHALDAATGKKLWTRSAPSADLRPAGGGRFLLPFFADDRWVLLQTTGGRRWLLRSDTGEEKTLAGDVGHITPHGRRCFLQRDGHLVMFDPGFAKELWSHQPTSHTTLTGEPFRIFGDETILLLLVPRNHGFQLDRLDPTTGKSLWNREGFLYRSGPAAVAHDSANVYLTVEHALECRTLADGKRKWRQELPGTHSQWQIVIGAKEVVVFPEPDDEPSWSWLPLGDSLLALPRAGRPSAAAYPLLIYDPHTGKLRERLDFAPASSLDTGLRAGWLGNRLIVAMAERLWGLEIREGK